MNMPTQRVYKYGLQPNSQINLPKNAKILTVAVQNEEVFLWAKVNPDELEMETRTFFSFETGHDMPTHIEMDFIGTVFFQNGMVFHVFEQIN